MLDDLYVKFRQTVFARKKLAVKNGNGQVKRKSYQDVKDTNGRATECYATYLRLRRSTKDSKKKWYLDGF